ncbi:hypothetical protein QM646_27715, partial [Rhodococcus erythropolis]|nr:hypothetical protein [Rhodococcus erythropolis]
PHHPAVRAVGSRSEVSAPVKQFDGSTESPTQTLASGFGVSVANIYASRSRVQRPSASLKTTMGLSCWLPSKVL